MLTRTFKKGFTLAEVLVTLVVIGIVAALSIPALLQNTNQAELKTAFKKSLATLNQALVMSVAQNATDAGSCCNASGAAGSLDLTNFFANKLNVISSNLTVTNPYFFTADGMQYTVVKKNNTCNSSEPNDPASANCVVLVDVNGQKSPNASSTGNTTASYTYRDQYQVIVRSNSIIPASNSTSDVAVGALQN